MASPLLSLKPAFQISLNLEEPTPVHAEKSYAEVNVPVVGGTIKSLDSEYPFNGTIISGRDDITVTPGSHNNLDCVLFGKTDDGFNFKVTYGGIVRHSEPVDAVLGKKSSGHTFEETYVTNNMIIKLSEDAPAKYDWLRKTNLVGRGRFFRDEADGLHIEYVMHAIV